VKVIKIIALCAFVAASFGLNACAKKQDNTAPATTKTYRK